MANCSPARWRNAVCSAAIQTLGGYGVVSDFFLWSVSTATCVLIYEGTSDVQKIIIQRALA